MEGYGSGSLQIMTDLDPEGPKTWASGSATLSFTISNLVYGVKSIRARSSQYLCFRKGCARGAAVNESPKLSILWKRINYWLCPESRFTEPWYGSRLLHVSGSIPIVLTSYDKNKRKIEKSRSTFIYVADWNLDLGI